MKILKYILIIVFSSSVCFAKHSKDSINEAIERLQAKIDIGINFRDYQIELGNLQYEYNKYHVVICCECSYKAYYCINPYRLAE